MAEHLLPNSSWDDRYRLARSVEHGALKEVCQWASGTGAGKRHVVPLVAALQTDPDISQLAAIASRLQEARHLADYDHLAVFGKASVLTSINEAELAIDTLDGLVGQPNLETMLSLVALQSKLH